MTDNVLEFPIQYASLEDGLIRQLLSQLLADIQTGARDPYAMLLVTLEAPNPSDSMASIVIRGVGLSPTAELALLTHLQFRANLRLLDMCTKAESETPQ